MKKTLIIILLFFVGLISHSQTQDILKSIAYELINNETYQAACEYTFSTPFGDTLTGEFFLNTKKVPTDKFCGFYYNFQTFESYRNEKFPDFTIYFDSIVYFSYLGKVKKTSYHESPSQFIEIKLENGFIPSIQKRTAFYNITPYEIGNKIVEIINDSNMIISQKPDTIIELDTCLRYILESKSENKLFDRSNPGHWKDGKTIYELCFHYSKHYPVLYKNEVFTPIANQMQSAHFRNTQINNKLPANYFSEENLLPVDWDKTEPTTQNEKKTPNELIGRQAPKWNLPVLGSGKTFSSENLKSKTVLIEFTATWCGACFRAAEMMNRLDTEFENNSNVEIISIYSSDLDKKESVERFAQKMNAKSTILYSAIKVGEMFNIQGYPNFFIISPEGIVTKYIPGYSPTIEQEIINALSKPNE
jgi:cytochrome c biogenesis protein CcmG/thiol:disulfide interchange protein DsbE